jgi:hypothetical protein
VAAVMGRRKNTFFVGGVGFWQIMLDVYAMLDGRHTIG